MLQKFCGVSFANEGTWRYEVESLESILQLLAVESGILLPGVLFLSVPLLAVLRAVRWRLNPQCWAKLSWIPRRMGEWRDHRCPIRLRAPECRPTDSPSHSLRALASLRSGFASLDASHPPTFRLWL